MNKSNLISSIVGGAVAGILVAVLGSIFAVQQIREIERRLVIAEERCLWEDRIGERMRFEEHEEGEAVAQEKRKRYAQLGLDPPGSYRIEKATLNELRVDTLRVSKIELIDQYKVELPDGTVRGILGGVVRGVLAAEDGKSALVLKAASGQSSTYGTNGIMLMRPPSNSGDASPDVLIHVDQNGRGYVGLSNGRSQPVASLEVDEFGAGYLLLKASPKAWSSLSALTGLNTTAPKSE